MPLDAHTWNGDFVTATLLDNDFYLFNGQMFVPNGIRFHARKPIYKSYNGYSTSLNTLTNGSWGYTFGTTADANPTTSVIVDSAGLCGAWLDPNTNGNIRMHNVAAGGGSTLAPGGLMLSASYCLWPANAGSGGLGCGFGLSSTPTVQPGTVGTVQAANSAHQTCAMCIDLVDGDAQRNAPLAFNGSGGSVAPVGTLNSDGSGWASRSMAHWVSVYQANGVTVSTLPNPIGNWTTSTLLTSAFLNGNTGFRGPLRFLNMPPSCRAQATGTQGLLANTNTTLNLAATSGMDTYSGFSSNTYTVPFTGLYFVHGYAGIGNISGSFKVGVNINGTNYWGPRSQCPGSGIVTGTKTQIFSLNAGDTITLQAAATAAATTSAIAVPRFIVTYVGARGTPAPLPNPPDTSFRWTAGTPGPNATLFNGHVANDLNFLIQKPYLMVYQTGAQNITPSSATTMNMDTVAGIVHGDAGDNYSGWNVAGNKYVAQRPGWYMTVEEVFLQAPTQTSTPSVLGLIGLNPGGADPFDRYQQQNMAIAQDGSGATVVSYYYLRAGDSVAPQIETYDSSATTIPTSTTVNSHFELVWLGE